MLDTDLPPDYQYKKDKKTKKKYFVNKKDKDDWYEYPFSFPKPEDAKNISC